LPPATVKEIITMAHTHNQLLGRVDLAYVDTLVKLAK
jgi:hypothetical protein